MYNVSVEQIIKTKAPKTAWLFKLIMAAACVAAFTTIPSTYTLGMFLTVILIILTVLLFRYYNSEYEYSLVDGELTVDKIMSRSFRRRCGVYNVARASLIAKAGSQEALRREYERLHTMDFTAHDGQENVVVMYALDNANNEQVRILLEPDSRMLAALKNAAPKGAFQISEEIPDEDV